jgi:hypothetical protein
MKNWIKGLVVVVFLSLLTMSVLNSWGAAITKEDLIFASMILLLVLVPELKDFNFWGMRGTSSIDIKAPTDADSISNTISPPTRDEVSEAEQSVTPQLMDTDTGNFLTLFAEIERLLNVAAFSLYPDQFKGKAKHGIISKVLKKQGFITSSGMDQLNAMRQVRNKLVHGMRQELSEENISQALQIAINFYQELDDWFKGQDTEER